MDTQTAKARAFQTLSEDGLVDLFSGIALVLIGIGWMFEPLFVLGISAPAVLVPLWFAVRKKVTEPRIGHVELREDTQMKVSRQLLWAVLLGSFVLGIVAFFSFSETTPAAIAFNELVPAIPTLIIAVMAVISWLLLRNIRFLVYALGLIVAGASVFAYSFPPHHGFLIGAIAPLIMGTWVFVEFMRSNPVIDAEA